MPLQEAAILTTLRRGARASLSSVRSSELLSPMVASGSCSLVGLRLRPWGRHEVVATSLKSFFSEVSSLVGRRLRRVWFRRQGNLRLGANSANHSPKPRAGTKKMKQLCGRECVRQRGRMQQEVDQVPVGCGARHQ